MAALNGVIYDSNWTRSIDDLFTQILEGYSFYYERELKVHDSWVLEQCRVDINRVFNKNFQMEDMVYRFFRLEDRYHTWRCIISREDVAYDEKSNTIAAKSKVWDEICQNYELGDSYRAFSEPQFTRLVAIFGSPQARRESHEAGFLHCTPTLYEAQKEYDNMKKEREVFRSFPHVIPRTNPPGNGYLPRGQYCPRPRFMDRQPTTYSRGESSGSSEIDMDVRAKQFNKY